MINSFYEVRPVSTELIQQIRVVDPEETREWIESLESLVSGDGGVRCLYLLQSFFVRARMLHIGSPEFVQTPYIYTIPPEEEPLFPGDEWIEKRIRRLIRWNAAVM